MGYYILLDFFCSFYQKCHDFFRPIGFNVLIFCFYLGCLPVPKKSKIQDKIQVFGILFIILIMTAMDSYTLRLRRVICAFFFPKVSTNLEQRISILGANIEVLCLESKHNYLLCMGHKCATLLKMIKFR